MSPRYHELEPTDWRQPERRTPGGPLHDVLHLLLPWTCLACERKIGRQGATLGLCRRCAGALRPVGGPRCRRCELPLPASAAGRLCGDCLAGSRCWTSLRAAWFYDHPLDRVMAAIKFRRLASLAEELGRRLGRRFAAEFHRDEVVTAVPLHWRRRWRRGFDQAELIGRTAAREVGLPYRRLLRRVRATTPQSRRSRRQRLAGLGRAFQAIHPAAIAARRIILVDDVVTTCATVDAASQALRRHHPASITVLAAARTPKD